MEKRLDLLVRLCLSEENAVGMLTRAPGILAYQSQQMLHIADYITSLGSFSVEDVAVLLHREPRILGYNLTGSSAPPSSKHVATLPVTFIWHLGIVDQHPEVSACRCDDTCSQLSEECWYQGVHLVYSRPHVQLPSVA